jgi:hypothetical protein
MMSITSSAPVVAAATLSDEFIGRDVIEHHSVADDKASVGSSGLPERRLPSNARTPTPPKESGRSHEMMFDTDLRQTTDVR